jgi:hypothetical protein
VPTQDQKIEHLKGHLPYELLMLRHTRERMNSPLYPLDWNAHHESFAVHARNLFDFLMNDATSANFKVSHFSTTFKAKKNDEVQRIIRQDLHSQVLHLGKNRESDEDKKVGHEKREKVFRWLEENMSSFVGGLDSSFKTHWDSDRADPNKFHQEYSNRPVTAVPLSVQSVTGLVVQSATTGSPVAIDTAAAPRQQGRRS